MSSVNVFNCMIAISYYCWELIVRLQPIIGSIAMIWWLCCNQIYLDLQLPKALNDVSVIWVGESISIARSRSSQLVRTSINLLPRLLLPCLCLQNESQLIWQQAETMFIIRSIASEESRKLICILQPLWIFYFIFLSSRRAKRAGWPFALLCAAHPALL